MAPCGRQHRWILWIVDLWLPFHLTLRGVRSVRVPSSWRAALVGLLLERYVTAPGSPHRGLRVPVADHALGNSVGATRMVSGA